MENVGPWEARLGQDRFDPALLTIVLIVYLTGQFRSGAARKARQRHVLRVIAAMPDVELAGTPLVYLSPHHDGNVFDQARRLWLKHVEDNPRDARLIGNAAAFFKVCDDVLAGELYRRCKALEPENPKWSWHLGGLYARAGRDQPPESLRDWGAMSMAEYERVRALSADGSKWAPMVLPSLAKAAYDAGAFVKARAAAEELLTNVAARPGAWWPGWCIHQGNLMLGRVALVEGDVELAKAHLLAAVTATGEEPVMFFGAGGPNTALAQDLLERGERDCVLDYLHRCAEYWTRIFADRNSPTI